MIKNRCDRAILSTLLFPALRRAELFKLPDRSVLHARKSGLHLKFSGKGQDALTAAASRDPRADPRLLGDRRAWRGRKRHAVPVGAQLPHGPARRRDYRRWRLSVGQSYSALRGFDIGAHALRATAETNALDHQADIAKVQEWLGNANIDTTRIYEHLGTQPDNSRTF